MDGVVAWLRSERAAKVLDAALILVVVAVGWAGMIAARSNPEISAAPLTVPMGLASAVAAVPLWWRRERPLAMVGAALALAVVASAIDDRGLFSGQAVLEAFVLCFAVGAWSARRRLAIVVVATPMVLTVIGVASDGGNLVAGVAYAFALFALPAALGYASRARRQYLTEVEQRLAEAERDRDERARRAVRDERARIARELHDVVAHHVSLIGVQAGAARMALDRSPERTRDALEGIEASSRAAVGEMRQLLDVLAPLPDAGATSDLAPQPAIADLPALFERWRSAGMSIESSLVGELGVVPPTVALCCYRIVEEALTNIARHSAARSMSIGVWLEPAAVRIEVADPGPPAAPGDGRATPGSGRGLVGMRERVALFGGELHAGPHVDGGYRVSAVIPWSGR